MATKLLPVAFSLTKGLEEFLIRTLGIGVTPKSLILLPGPARQAKNIINMMIMIIMTIINQGRGSSIKTTDKTKQNMYAGQYG